MGAFIADDPRNYWLAMRFSPEIERQNGRRPLPLYMIYFHLHLHVCRCKQSLHSYLIHSSLLLPESCLSASAYSLS